MSRRLCPRCHAELLTEDNGELTFCSHCGAPQIVLSEELRERLERQLAQPDAQQPSADGPQSGLPGFATPPPIADPAAVVWSRALQLVGLAGVFFAALALLTAAFSPVILVVALWLFGAPIILLGIYGAKNPATRITTGFGARLGMLSGLSIGLAGLFINLLALFLSRFVLHQGDVLDNEFANLFSQVGARQLAQVPADQLAEMQHLLGYLNVPEFRAGFLLFCSVVTVFFYAVYSTVAGAFSGALRSRAAAR